MKVFVKLSFIFSFNHYIYLCPPKADAARKTGPQKLSSNVQIQTKNNMKKRKFLVKRIARNVQTDFLDLRSYYDVDSCAEKVMKPMTNQVSPQLYGMLMQQLLGFHKDMQIEMAVNLVDFACEHIARSTGCASVDCVLDVCYSWIAIEHGIVRPSFRELLNNVRV